MDTLLKDMHLSLHDDFTALTQKFFAEVSMLGDRVHQVENAIADITTTVNGLVDANDEKIEERNWFCVKIADLEDHFRQNNLKLRGVPEFVFKFSWPHAIR